MSKKMILNSQKAMISVDFLFSFLIVMGLTYLILALALSLSFVELTQYISFSTARSYYAANKNQTLQRQQAEQKYRSLVAHDAWAHFFKKLSWFKIDSADSVIKNRDSYFNNQFEGQPELFTGASTKFTTKLLAFNIPFIGSTAPEEDEDPGFTTKISSYLGREPNAEECRNFNRERIKILKSLCRNCDNFKAFSIADNGC